MGQVVIANWKMNFSLNEAINFCNILTNPYKDTLIIAAPTLYLSYLSQNFPDIAFASQDVSSESAYYGAYTGEISAKMLSDIGIRYSIIGHSERRINKLETSEIVKRKATNCIKNNITPIICIGETQEARSNNSHLKYIKNQIIESIPDSPSFILAYEPIWAIGSGNMPNISELMEVFSFIENIIAKDITLVYGGSVNLRTIDLVKPVSQIHGILLGKASLDVVELEQIIENLSC